MEPISFIYCINTKEAETLFLSFKKKNLWRSQLTNKMIFDKTAELEELSNKIYQNLILKPQKTTKLLFSHVSSNILSAYNNKDVVSVDIKKLQNDQPGDLFVNQLSNNSIKIAEGNYWTAFFSKNGDKIISIKVNDNNTNDIEIFKKNKNNNWKPYHTLKNAPINPKIIIDEPRIAMDDTHLYYKIYDTDKYKRINITDDYNLNSIYNLPTTQFDLLAKLYNDIEKAGLLKKIEKNKLITLNKNQKKTYDKFPKKLRIILKEYINLD